MKNAPTHQQTGKSAAQRHLSKKASIAGILSKRSLNRFEAERLGDHCLHSTISELRRSGFTVVDQWERVPTRFGNLARVKRYRIVRGPGA